MRRRWRKASTSGRYAAGNGVCSGAAPISTGGFVYTNTFFNPITLSWKLGGGWFVSAGFNFTAPDGTRQVGTPNPDYWTLEPALAVSYVGSNWVFSANMFERRSLRQPSGGRCWWLDRLRFWAGRFAGLCRG